MSLQEKYRGVLNLGETLNARNASVKESGGKLHYAATVETQRQKDLLWDKIKQAAGEDARDIKADIRVTETGYYTRHTVQKGDSLSKMAKEYYSDPLDYKRIFQANTDVLENPSMIYPGQELVIPFPEGRTADR